MNEKQMELLEKEFKVNDRFSITRGDYEDMPCPMLAWTWSDKRMKELAENISRNLADWDDDDPEGMEDDFWKTMEDEAVHMDMAYYEDLEDDEMAALQFKWTNIK